MIFAFHILTVNILAAFTGLTFATSSTEKFLSRPRQETIALDILINGNRSAIAPGYIFITPYKSFFSRTSGPSRWGPHIFDSEGNLVWAGNYTVEIRGWALHVCSYNGQSNSHLCFGDGRFDNGHTLGVNRFFDNTYTEVKRVGAKGGLGPPDGHEFNTPVVRSGYTLLQDVYQKTKKDLRKWGGKKEGWIFNGCFQDIEVVTGKVLFQWCSLDHLSPDATFVHLPGQGFSVGSGGGIEWSPWDYFHINAIDQDSAGDYYVSAKAMCAIYKIAGRKSAFGKPGTVIWKLGGHENSFTMEKNLIFAFQHHVRVHDVGSSKTILSIFDNAYAGENKYHTSNSSSGMVIEINNLTMTARLIERYFQPDGLLSGAQGSVQRPLENGNIFIGWGPNQFISEHAPGMPGKVLFYAKIGPGLDLESYRNFKYPWVGKPKSPPDAFAYQENCNSDLLVYMSWNGATEYRAWRIFVANSSTDPGSEVGDGIWPRTGYETVADTGRATKFRRYVYVQALDKNDEVLGTSKHTKVFVPTRRFHQNNECTSIRCRGYDGYSDDNSQAEKCG